MKYTVSVMCLIFLLTGLLTAQQQESSFFVTYGYLQSFAPDKITDFWRNGFQGGIGYGYSFYPCFTLLGTVDYIRWHLNEERFKATFLNGSFADTPLSVNGGTVSSWNFSVHIKYSFKSINNVVDPYITGGAGLFLVSLNNTTGTTDTARMWIDGIKDIRPGLTAGSGARVLLGKRFGYSINAQLFYLFTKESYTIAYRTDNGINGPVHEAVPVNINSDIKFVLINVGVFVRF
ncbi:outer membrane beta-barrel protein [candidate division KSB1 bacterium]